jgi:hypothetical protein
LSDSGGKKSGRRIVVMDECGLHDRAVFVFPGARSARDAARDHDSAPRPRNSWALMFISKHDPQPASAA